jgi:hypothetical protein
MAGRRRTNADRERERAEAEDRVWEQFRRRLAGLKTFTDARVLASESPRPDAPGRHYYSNLDFFLGAFTVPFGSSHEEKALYLQFIQRLEATGQLKPGEEKRIEAALRQAMEAQKPS